MSVELTVRHTEINEKVQTFAREKGEMLIQEFPHIEHVKIVLDKDGPFYVAIFNVQGGQACTVESDARGEEFMFAITSAAEKAYIQLRKHAQKRQEVRS
ncbi:MAG: HPF/RaiA family ribosome-associated protein [Kiritimatiellae bacterium]|nr:HPF/RaiA family ribosome-associated protein [Kiritimatiellia bacterium]